MKRLLARLARAARRTRSRASVDDASGINSQDFDNGVQYGSTGTIRTYDRGPSAFHATHNLTFNWTLGRSGAGIARAASPPRSCKGGSSTT